MTAKKRTRKAAASPTRWHRAVIVDYTRLRAFPGVVSVGLGMKERGAKLTRRQSVKIYVREKPAALHADRHLPKKAHVLVPVGRGLYRSRWLPTDVVELPSIVRAAGNHGRLDPVASGAEIGLVAVNGGPGTFGCVVRVGAALRLLTAGHVVLDHDGEIPANIEVYQPQPQFPREDFLLGATAAGFVGNDVASGGYVDAALITPANGGRTATNVAWDPRVGSLAGFLTLAAVQDGKVPVHKVGARTGYTLGEFSVVHPHLVDDKTATDYHNVIEFLVSDAEPAGVLGERGDSGAVLVSRAPARAGMIAGLLFAVSPDGRRGFAVPFDRLMDRFGLSMPSS